MSAHSNNNNPRLISRNVRVRDSRTSMRLEPEFWGVLQEMAANQNLTVSEVVNNITNNEPAKPKGHATGAVRVATLKYFLQAAIQTAGNTKIRSQDLMTSPVGELKDGNITTDKGRTSVRLHKEYWDVLREMTETKSGYPYVGPNIHGDDPHRTSGVRVAILKYAQGRANPETELVT